MVYFTSFGKNSHFDSHEKLFIWLERCCLFCLAKIVLVCSVPPLYRRILSDCWLWFFSVLQESRNLELSVFNVVRQHLGWYWGQLDNPFSVIRRRGRVGFQLNSCNRNGEYMDNCMSSNRSERLLQWVRTDIFFIILFPNKTGSL